MYIFSGIFGASFASQQLGTTDTQVRKIEVFPIKSFSQTGTPSLNTTNMFLGLETGCLPYIIVPTGIPLTIDYGQHFVAQKIRNFFIKGTQGDGYYIIVHP